MISCEGPRGANRRYQYICVCISYSSVWMGGMHACICGHPPRLMAWQSGTDPVSTHPPAWHSCRKVRQTYCEPWVCIRDGSLDRSLWLRLRLMLRRRFSVSAVAAAEMQLRLSADAVAAAENAAAALG